MTTPVTPRPTASSWANPPFAGSLDYESTAKDLLQVVKTKETELHFLALFLRLLKSGGRAAGIVGARAPQKAGPDQNPRSEPHPHDYGTVLPPLPGR